MPLNIPNILTWLRILMIPLFVLILYVPFISLVYLPVPSITEREANLAATIVFVVAALTDWLDGYLARVLNQTSAFGAFLDPVADKLMVTAALIVLVQLGRVDAIVALIIIGREIAISALREWMAKVGQSRKVAVSYVGKIKTVAQMVAIPFLLYYETIFGFVNCRLIGNGLIWLAALLTFVSMVYYLRIAFPFPVKEN
jgi:cardiolipin synthase (CMP-forming)